jgi:hypothetical protein
LGFGAADYQAEVWVNGAPAGGHQGGYLPFEFDVTAKLRAGANTLTVRVADPPELFPEIPHGKQAWYGPLSGLWQPVWLERRPATHLLDLRVTPGDQAVDVNVRLSRPLAGGQSLAFSVLDPEGALAAHAEAPALAARLSVPAPQPWEPDAPRLYTLRVVLSGGGAPEDRLETPFGFRTIRAEGGQLLLNGRPLYLRGALDQDYYPNLICTPPSSEYLEAQFRQAKAMGLNCLRLHLKVADPRYYAAADRVGLLIWSELPSWEHLTPAARSRALETLAGMVARDWNHPSIILWTIVNEGWGLDLSQAEHRDWLAEVYATLRALDPHRLVVDNSPCWGNFHVVTDVEDFHYYCGLPDHSPDWRAWLASFAGRPAWTFAYGYPATGEWRAFRREPWNTPARPPAPEVRRRGDEPLIVSEFGNWGLPDVARLKAGYGGEEPWWFESGQEWAGGVVYPHGVEARFRAYHLERAFPTLSALAQASQAGQLEALKYQIEQMRLQPSLQGYVITQFTDVHWESNGLLDLQRGPKRAAAALRDFNADDVIVPEWTRLAYWAGEVAEVHLSLSHYGAGSLAGSRLEWALEDWPEAAGTFEALAPPRWTVSAVGTVRFVAPAVMQAARARLVLRLVAADGHEAARTEQALYFFPRPAAPGPDAPRLFSDRLAAPLRALGYTVVDSLAEAGAAVVTALTDALRDWVWAGGRAVWLAESEGALQTDLEGLGIVSRRGRAWEGNWASSFSWINPDRLFGGLPTGGRVDFAFAGLTPEHVLTGFGPRDYARRVHAGLTVGWLHQTAALVAERPVGAGRLLSSTFRLSEHLATHPVASAMIGDMVAEIEHTRRS